MRELIPELKLIPVDTAKLLLDPNNPRFVTNDNDHVPFDRIADPEVIERTSLRMSRDGKQDAYQIEQLVSSILTNGWQEIDSIFVRRYKKTDLYLVCEGNRRVTAIREILRRNDIPQELRDKLSRIHVLEIQGNHSEAEIARQVAYLLGVRHHGALKRWSPFAQARNIFKTYVEYANYASEDEFRWNDATAHRVAEALSIPPKQVKERLRVYRGMVSVASLPEVGPDRIRDHYYSLFDELLSRDKGPLAQFIAQDSATFALPVEAAQRMENLCHFSKHGRKGSPITNPQEWRAFENILKDDDETKRAANLLRVTEAKEQPSSVWAQRTQELKRLEWARWLEKVSVTLARVPLGDIDLEDQNAIALVKRLASHLDELKAKVNK